MLWVESVIIDGDQVTDATDLAGARITVHALSARPRRLLVHVTIRETDEHRVSYDALTVLGVAERAGGDVAIDALRPLTGLARTEQHAIQRWLVARHWPAWARALPAVRELLGDHEAPVLLAEAARSWSMPLATLTTAVAQERLPAIAAGDRHLVYLSTIGEAQERGLLHVGRGRPRRSGAREG